MDNDSFFSVDRLVEFGMSLAVARQMVNTMNQTMQNMWVSGAQNTLTQSQTQVYYAIVDNVQVGPCSESELMKLVNQHKIKKDTYVWTPGMTSWQTADKIPVVMRLVALSPPPFEINEK